MKNCQALLIEELKLHGVAGWTVREGGKRPRLLFQWAGREVAFVFSRRPTDFTAIENCLTRLRKIMGVRKISTVGHGKPTPRRSVAPVTHSVTPTLTIRPDPWAPLAAWAYGGRRG